MLMTQILEFPNGQSSPLSGGLIEQARQGHPDYGVMLRLIRERR